MSVHDQFEEIWLRGHDDNPVHSVRVRLYADGRITIKGMKRGRHVISQLRLGSSEPVVVVLEPERR